MTIKQIIPWRWGGLRSWEDEERPFESFLHGWILSTKRWITCLVILER